ncbi:MAG: hypothetical protein V4719_16495 [Planctomycetota bacterium]
MRQMIICVTLSLVLPPVAGCGRSEPPFTDNSQDVDLYVRRLRMLVQHQTALARKSDPTLHLAPLVIELEREDRPLGEYQDVYLSLREKGRAVFDLCRANPNVRHDIAAQLDEMVNLASALPAREEEPATPVGN